MNILVIAPHADDEVLGVGATMAKHVAAGDGVYVCVVTRGVEPMFTDAFMQRLREETVIAHNLLGVSKTFFLELPATMLERVPRHELNDRIRGVVEGVTPDIVYIPHFGDTQKDHRLVSEAAMVATRPKYTPRIRCVYAYETLSETEWNTPHNAYSFLPNAYVDVSDYLDKKLEALSCFGSQLLDFPQPRSLLAVEALARYRGATINSMAAEAFALIRGIT